MRELQQSLGEDYCVWSSPGWPEVELTSGRRPIQQRMYVCMYEESVPTCLSYMKVRFLVLHIYYLLFYLFGLMSFGDNQERLVM